MSEAPRNPVVFVSYSHDSKEHKQWVLELAQKLRAERIDVVIDQWDLEYGDDVPKFMEHWVTAADRVLMICTEPYVRKVDEGRGGAGYEAMVVTQELIRNLGTKKFVPVVRQSAEPVLLPKCVGTRMAVNLSSYADADSEFRRLVTQLHQLPPPTKPPLGPGPSLTQPLPPGLAVALTSNPNAEPKTVYQEGMSLARAGDIVTWRKAIAAQKAASLRELSRWRDETLKSAATTSEEAQERIRAGLAVYQPLFALAVAGVESGETKFRQHASLVYDLLEVNDWDSGGPRVIGAMPQAAAWAFHSLIGAMCVHTNQLDLALELATQRIQQRHSDESRPLFLKHELVGWPDVFDKSCTKAWPFLLSLAQHFPWVAEAFGDEESFQACLEGYYILLSWLEFIDMLEKGKASLLDREGSLRPDVPPMFLEEALLPKAIRKVLEDRRTLIAFAQTHGVSAAEQIKHWPVWINRLFGWLDSLYHIGLRRHHPEAIDHFAADMNR